jgi:glutathione S-transferase
MLKLYHHPGSVCAQKVRLVLEELRIPWTSIVIDIHGGEQLREEYLRINPRGVVPTLDTDGRIIIESNIIIEFLADAHGDALRPKDAYPRARMRLWLKRLDENLHRSCGILTGAANASARAAAIVKSGRSKEEYFSLIPDAGRREWLPHVIEFGVRAPEVPQALKCFVDTVDDMAKVLATQPYLVGSDYTLADAGLTPYVMRLDRLGMAEVFERYPAVIDWYRRITARPNFADAIAIYDQPGDVGAWREGGEAAWRELRATVFGSTG